MGAAAWRAWCSAGAQAYQTILDLGRWEVGIYKMFFQYVVCAFLFLKFVDTAGRDLVYDDWDSVRNVTVKLFHNVKRFCKAKVCGTKTVTAGFSL